MLAQYRIMDALLEGCQVIGPDWRYLYVNDAVLQHARRTREELVGRTMMEVYPGIDGTEMFATLRRCAAERTTANFENEFVYPDGTVRWFELRIQPVPEGLFILSLDITDRKRADLQVAHQLQRLHALRAIDLAILGTTDLRVALKTVLNETTRQLAVDGAAVFEFRPETGTLDVAEAVGLRREASRTRIGEGAIGRAALERRTVLVGHAGGPSPAPGDVPANWTRDGMRALGAVPLVAKGRLLGVLAVAQRTPMAPDDTWRDFLEALAGQAAMAVDAGRMLEDLQRFNLDLLVAYDSTIEGWSRALDLRDAQTSDHSTRVANLAVALARLAGMTPAELVHVRRGALLHDIGKMAVPDTILRKGGELSDEEWAIMRQHPVHAYEMLSPIPYLRPALDIPYCHHEKWDGSGYPRGLKGEQIPLAARLFAVIDVWDALRSDRPYRRAWPEARVRGHLRELAGSHLDPRAVELFLSLPPDQLT